MNKVLAIGMICFAALTIGRAQSPVAAWTQKFDAYQELLPGTKLELLFNQDKYSGGDTVWFKAYFLSENRKGIPGKQLMNLDLVNTEGKSMAHLLFAVNDGVGYNQFVIPDSLSAGIYLVAVYNNWMRNFEPPQFFKKEITIVRENRVTRKENDINVVAEGGHFIAGIPNKVIIIARPMADVRIIDSSGMDVMQTTAGNDGMAVVMLTPSLQTSYVIQYLGESGRFPLPSVEKDGVGLRVTLGKGNGDPVHVIIKSPPTSNYRNDEIAILVSSRGKIYYTTTFTQQNRDSVSVVIPGKDMPEGIAHVSILGPSGKVLASRDFYSQGSGGVQAKITLNKHMVAPRGEVSLEISLTDDRGQSVAGEFSIDVLNADLFDTEKQTLLTPDVAVFTGFPDGSIGAADTTWKANLDNQMIMKTVAVPWHTVLTSSAVNPVYNFTNVIQKKGRAYLEDTGLPVPDQTSIMFYLQDDKIPYEVKTSAGGLFTLSIFDLYGKDELFYMAQARGKDVPKIKIEWVDDAITLPHAPGSIETSVTDPYAQFTFRQRLIDKSYNVYSTSADIVVSTGKPAEDDMEDIVNGADVTVDVQDYVKFLTMEELVKEVIPALYFRKRGDRGIIRVKYLNPPLAPGEPPFIPGSPIYIIDGIVTRNTDFFLSLVPAELLTVGIIYDPRKLARFGMMGTNGIVIVQTKSGDVREPLRDPTMALEGLNIPLPFFNSENTADQSTTRPVFRSTVYWNPIVKTDSNGKATVKFHCSDDVGTMNISVRGLSADGIPFSAAQKLEVSVVTGKN